MSANDPKWDIRGAIGLGGSAPSREGLIEVLESIAKDYDAQIEPLEMKRNAIRQMIQTERETLALEQFRRDRTQERIQSPISRPPKPQPPGSGPGSSPAQAGYGLSSSGNASSGSNCAP